MTILIAGAYSSFCKSLIERLKRERHEVYLVSGNSSANPDAPTPKNCVNYSFDLTDERLDSILYSVIPDAVVFLGALDEQYDFTLDQKASMAYLASLSNLLIVSAKYNVPNFIYLSSANVYGTEYNMPLTEKLPKSPEDIGSFVVAQGEEICLNYNKMSGMDAKVLRFSEIYGNMSERMPDFSENLFRMVINPKAGKGASFDLLDDKYFSPIYVSDAIDAVFKALTTEEELSGIYNVSSGKEEMRDVYYKVYNLVNGVKTKKTSKSKSRSKKGIPDYSVDHTLFTEKFNYRPIVDIDKGLERVYRNVLKAKKKEDRKKSRSNKNKVLKVVAPFIENILFFAAMAVLAVLSQSNAVFLGVDLMILYVVIVSVTFGLSQGSIAILLASLFSIWNTIERSALMVDVLVDSQIILTVLQFMLIGTICGFAKDRMRTKINEKNAALEEVQHELNVIYEINDSNIKIKQTLDKRLINYGDSLAKIYSIVEDLNSLQADEIFFSAIKVVMDIMQAEDVTIYIVTGNDFKMCRLVAKTPVSERTHRKSIPLKDWGELAATVEENRVYVNKDLNEELPMMAAPVFADNKLVSLVMLWGIAFENLTPYNVNRFFVVSQLISSAIGRAYKFTQSTNTLTRIEGTRILTPEAFNDVLRIHKEAEKANTANYETLILKGENNETGMQYTYKELAEKAQAILRDNDYLGKNEEDDLSIYILLANTNEADAKFVHNRLEEAGLIVKEVAL